jgi:hypothetical protein
MNDSSWPCLRFNDSQGAAGIDGVSSFSYTIAAGAKALTSFGTPTNHYYYAASANTLDRLTPKTTTVFNVASAPGGSCMAIQQPDNRMVLGKGDKVWFSNAGDADTWGVNDFVTLRPGDGDSIRAMAVYNNQLLVFKERGIWSFYGNSTDSSGNAIFNVREVDDSNGVFTANPPHAVAVTPHGVYFPGKDGIYITRGGPAERISTPLDPLFKQTTNSFYTGTTIANSGISFWGSSMCWFNNRLYISVQVRQHGRPLLHPGLLTGGQLLDALGRGRQDLRGDPGDGLDPSKLVFGAGSGIFALDPTVTTDNGSSDHLALPLRLLRPRQPRQEAHPPDPAGHVRSLWGRGVRSDGQPEHQDGRPRAGLPRLPAGSGEQNFGYDAQGNLITGGANYDPYSQAMVLQRNYDNTKRGTVNNYAAQGQLYSGALLNKQGLRRLQLQRR